MASIPAQRAKPPSPALPPSPAAPNQGKPREPFLHPDHRRRCRSYVSAIPRPNCQLERNANRDWTSNTRTGCGNLTGAPTSKLDRLECLYVNARSCRKLGSLDALGAYCKLNSIHIVFLTEAWLNSNVSDRELSLDDTFFVFRTDRQSRGGGVCILVSIELRCSSLPREAIGVDVHHQEGKVRFVCCYVTPTNRGRSKSQTMERKAVDEKPSTLYLTQTHQL